MTSLSPTFRMTRVAVSGLVVFAATALVTAGRPAESAPSKNIKGTYKGKCTPNEGTPESFTLTITKQTKLPTGAYLLEGKVKTRGLTFKMTNGILNLQAEDNLSMTGPLGPRTAPTGSTGILGSINLKTRKFDGTWNLVDLGNSANTYQGTLAIKKSSN